MYAKQVCVFLENKKGRIAEVDQPGRFPLRTNPASTRTATSSAVAVHT